MHVIKKLMVNYDTQDNILILTAQFFDISSSFGKLILPLMWNELAVPCGANFVILQNHNTSLQNIIQVLMCQNVSSVLVQM